MTGLLDPKSPEYRSRFSNLCLVSAWRGSLTQNRRKIVLLFFKSVFGFWNAGLLNPKSSENRSISFSLCLVPEWRGSLTPNRRKIVLYFSSLLLVFEWRDSLTQSRRNVVALPRVRKKYQKTKWCTSISSHLVCWCCCWSRYVRPRRPFFARHGGADSMSFRTVLNERKKKTVRNRAKTTTWNFSRIVIFVRNPDFESFRHFFLKHWCQDVCQEPGLGIVSTFSI